MAYTSTARASLGDATTAALCDPTNKQSPLNNPATAQRALQDCFTLYGGLNLTIGGNPSGSPSSTLPAMGGSGSNVPFGGAPQSAGSQVVPGANSPITFSVFPTIPGLVKPGATSLVLNPTPAADAPISPLQTNILPWNPPAFLANWLNNFNNSGANPADWPWWVWAILIGAAGLVVYKIIE